ncbi:hypothetical protein ABT084_29660 [Streptomyces sp. NPDC002138]|uniref:hypothetical protein n=1 Tax=Streptomyces sp. NPDC002138 TaxID=3154410 RepID=UPI00331F3E34
MRARHVAMAVVIMAVLGTAACSPGPSTRASTGAPAPASAPGSSPGASAPASAPGSSQGRLRDGLLTAARLPQGFLLMTEQINATTTGAPHAPASTVPIASMPCTELGVESFVPRHARPLEDVAVGLERQLATDTIEDGGVDDSWFGQEVLDRYAPGQAAAVMSAVRDAAGRCPSYTTTYADGDHGVETVTVAPADVPADDGLVLRISTVMPGSADPFISESAFVREGDVILTVQKIGSQRPRAGVEAVLAPAVAAYRATTRG